MPTATEIPDIATKSEHEIAEFRARLNQSNLGDEDKELAVLRLSLFRGIELVLSHNKQGFSNLSR